MPRRLRWRLPLRSRPRRHLHTVLDAVGAVRHDALAALEPFRDLRGRVAPRADRNRLRVRDVLRIDDEYLEPLAIGYQRGRGNRDGVRMGADDDLAEDRLA